MSIISCYFDETFKGRVHFGDGLRINVEGRGTILLNTHRGRKIALAMFFGSPSLKENVFSLGRHDEQGCMILLQNGILTIHDEKKLNI